MREWIEQPAAGDLPPEKELINLLLTEDEELLSCLYARARRMREEHYGRKVYIRGLIEFTNFCRNNCYYCGIRRDNKQTERYRLSEQQIMECAQEGYFLGFRTFVLQGGEDPWYNTERVERLVRMLKERFPDCAVTLSVGECSRETYRRWREAGADRYLLRHETADPGHYGMLHPPELSWENRMRCLNDLKELGYQVGCGFMVGSPGQTAAHLARELRFLKEFRPHMVGLGPFIPQKDTKFAQETAGTLSMTLKCLALVRLILPDVLLPATTALGTIAENGTELVILAGANVVMPNLTPAEERRKYTLYDHKACTGSEAAEGLAELKGRMEKIGYYVSAERGDWKGEKNDV